MPKSKLFSFLKNCCIDSIEKFTDNWGVGDDIVIHCWCGVSRSMATATYLMCKKNIKDIESFIIDLKLSLKAKFLQPLIKKFYKRYLTALILKINAREVHKQIK